VATLSSIVWENCTPVFVDIHPEYLTIDETKIESAITPQTTCILATHVYGNPCNVESISKLALKYNLKVIYDAAHAFGVEVDNQSVFKHGDIATCSFHATKIFHTGEGGALFANDPELLAPLFHFHNFGHNGPHNFHSVGINAKMSELQAALGLAVLPYFNEIKEKRKLICQMYLSELAGSNFQFLKIRENTNWNFSYFPIIFETEEQLLKVEKSLNNQQIFPRRYFYPSLNTLSYIQTKIIMPISESISKRILCLPIYHDLSPESISKISSIIKDQLIINSK
jgi:dTDP-4-amino-4,6-dideoxygalactose transaminase